MKRLPKISYLAAALATVVGTNTILLTPTFTAVTNTTSSNANTNGSILTTAVVILASVVTLGLYSLIRRHNN